MPVTDELDTSALEAAIAAAERELKRLKVLRWRLRLSEAMQRCWKRADSRSRMVEAIREAQAQPEVRAKRSVSMKRALKHPDVRAKISERKKRDWADPVVRERHLAGIRRADVVAKLSASREAREALSNAPKQKKRRAVAADVPRIPTLAEMLS